MDSPCLTLSLSHFVFIFEATFIPAGLIYQANQIYGIMDVQSRDMVMGCHLKVFLRSLQKYHMTQGWAVNNLTLSSFSAAQPPQQFNAPSIYFVSVTKRTELAEGNLYAFELQLWDWNITGSGEESHGDFRCEAAGWLSAFGWVLWGIRSQRNLIAQITL